MWPWFGWNPWASRWPGYGMPYGNPYGGYGYGYSPWGPMPKEQEIAMLEEQAKALQDDLDDINKRLEELRK